MTGTTRRTLLYSSASMIAVAVAGCVSTSPESQTAALFETATVHLDPDCGCCELHGNYLEDAGVEVERITHTSEELSALKAEYGIPPEYRSCHTTLIPSGHVIEGHVPVGIMNDVFESEPAASVISLPDMPSGSPGMPGSKDEEWVFYALDEDGESEVYAKK